MPISKSFLYKEVAGEYMIIPLMGGNMDMTKIFNLNEVGAFIYKGLKEYDDVDVVVKKLTEEYAVDVDTARTDVLAFVEELKKRGIYE